SQILNLRYGPDGQVYVLDWYDMQACHLTDPDKHDRSNGRVYKVIYGKPAKAEVNLKERTGAQLAGLMLHENDWYVRHARRILQERAAAGKLEPSVRPSLVKMATTHSDDTRRLRAMWALHVTGGLPDELVAKLLGDPSPYVRGWAVQLALDREGFRPPPKLLSRFAEMARGDDSPVVRLYLAAALQRLPLEARWDILAGLVSHPEDAADHNLPLMYWYAAEPLADADPERALAFGLSAGETIPLLREFMLRRIGSAEGSAAVGLLVRGLGKAGDARLQLVFLEGIRGALRGQRRVEPPEGWGEIYGKLAQSPDEDVRFQASALAVTFGDVKAAEAFRKLAGSDSAPEAKRREALATLLRARDPGLVPLLHRLVQSPALRADAIRGLARYDDAKTPTVLLSVYDKLTPAEKRAAVATLCSRTGYARELLAAVEKKQVPGTDLTADLVRQLRDLGDAQLDAQLARVWGTARESDADKKKLIDEYKRLLTESAPAKPDPWLGRAVFAKTCQQCHTLYGVGGNVGPDLTGSNRSDLDYLLSNILDPGAVMAKEYQPTVFITDEDRIITGIVKGEDAKTVTVQTADETIVLPKDGIAERRLSPVSMMPEDQLKQFDEHHVRSLFAYLSGKTQVPVLAVKDNAGLLFNGKDLTGWTGDKGLWSVENGEIVGRSSGLNRNEFLVSDLAAEDFRLSLEVKLAGDAGNSGIQFRSRARPDGDVAGYQADVGPGWWGKLYEEHGRGLLWDKSGEAHVKKGGWNAYVIEARGDRIRTWINGKPCVDLEDPAGARRGVFALQLHSGGPTEVRFRNLRLEVLDGGHDHEHPAAAAER
ncbi:MAG TPA: family 16 glycoside hydrolase, partial [Gemmataceae bacterium]